MSRRKVTGTSLPKLSKGVSVGTRLTCADNTGAKVIEIMKKYNKSDDKLEEVIDKDKGHEAPKDKGDDAGPTSKKPKTRTPIKR